MEDFLKACETGNIDCINNSIQNNIFSDKGLFLASQNRQIDVIKILLKDKRINPTKENGKSFFSQLHDMEKENPGLVEIGILAAINNYDVHPMWFDNYLLRLSVINGNTKIFKRLLMDKRVNPLIKPDYATPILQCAVFNGNVKIVELILDDGRFTIYDYKGAYQTGLNKKNVEIMTLFALYPQYYKCLK